MILAALLVFGALLLAWLLAPAEPRQHAESIVELEGVLAEAA
jgi:hypothetical protein